MSLLSSGSGYLIAIIVGAGLGWICQRLFGADKAKYDLLKEKLVNTEKEFAGYRQEIAEHFSNTSKLFLEMSNNYKNIYQYLAHTEQKFADPSSDELGVENFALQEPYSKNLSRVEEALVKENPLEFQPSHRVITAKRADEYEYEHEYDRNNF